MSKLKFNDGVEIDTSGPKYYVTKKRDGYYVVGNGFCGPVDSREEGEEFIKKMTGK